LRRAAQVPHRLAEFGLEKRLNHPAPVPAFNAPAQTNDIEIIIRHALLRRKMVFNQAGVNAPDFVGTYKTQQKRP